MRKFIALVDEFGYDDGGVASFTFKVQSLKKDKIYYEHQRWVEAWDGRGGKKQEPSGFVIDDNGCWNEIGSDYFKNKFKEIKEEDNAK